MKKLRLNLYIAALLIVGASCEQELVENTASPCPSDDPTIVCPEVVVACPEGASAGTASFTKFVAVGNSFVAGVQGGALFTTGQNNSMAAIINKQLECVGAPASFVQPPINASLGWNLFVTQPFLTDNTKPILGRMLLQYNGAASPRPTPQAYAPGNIEALPSHLNPNFMYSGSKIDLNVFAVPAITLGQFMTPATGGPVAPPAPNPAYSPFYRRFASSPSPDGTAGSSVISDAKAAGGTFFLIYFGLDDFFLHAAFGADPARAPLTSGATFAAQYNAALFAPSTHTGLLTANPDSKAVVGNFPDIFLMPHFTSVPWNAIVFAAADQAKVTQTNGAYAAYNGGLDAAFGGGFISAAERDKRRITFAVGANGIVIEDETLTDLTAMGLPSIRQATSADKFPLSAGTVLGTEATPGNPATTWGVGKALTDQYALIPSEIEQINATRTSFNASIQALVTANPTRLALADVSSSFTALTTAGAAIGNNITLTPNINPPTGIYSEDGAHLNSRGYAFMANIFIDAINAKFGASIPKANYANYSATALPIP